MTSSFPRRVCLSLLAVILLLATSPLIAQESDTEFPWQERVGVVSIFSNFPLTELEDLHTDVEELQEDLIHYLGVPNPQEDVCLYLFDGPKSYVRYIQEHWPVAPLDRPALYIKDNGPGMLLIKRDKNIRINIRHEMTHAILNASLLYLPIWLDEGLAKYFEIPRGQRGYDNPFLKTVRQNATFFLFGRAPSLERLERLTQINQMQEREYRESWGWVHFLIHDSQETHYLLAGYLASYSKERQKGISPEQAEARQQTAPLTLLLKEKLPNYKQEYVTHFKNWGQK